MAGLIFIQQSKISNQQSCYRSFIDKSTQVPLGCSKTQGLLDHLQGICLAAELPEGDRLKDLDGESHTQAASLARRLEQFFQPGQRFSGAAISQEHPHQGMVKEFAGWVRRRDQRWFDATGPFPGKFQVSAVQADRHLVCAKHRCDPGQLVFLGVPAMCLDGRQRLRVLPTGQEDHGFHTLPSYQDRFDAGLGAQFEAQRLVLLSRIKVIGIVINTRTRQQGK